MRTLTICWSILLAVLPQAGLADDAGSSEPRFASKEEYSACLDAADAVDERRSRFNSRQRQHQEMAAKFQAAEADLAAQVRKHRPSTKAEIESYNRAIAKRNSSVKSLNIEAQSLQLELNELNDQVVENNTRCGGLVVAHEVADAVERERKGREKPR
jgi:chromosome segregation ATPase